MNARISCDRKITYIDIIKWQIVIVSGEKLTFDQNDIHIKKAFIKSV
jgi:acetyl/propionyl-CoA carboxylase alpha subunit